MIRLPNRAKLGVLVVVSLLFTLILYPGVPAAQSLEDEKKLIEQVNELYNQGRYREAIPIAERVLAVFEKNLGSDHTQVAILLTNLAELYKNSGDYDNAELLYKRALTIREKVFGPDHLDVAASLINLASLYQTLKDYGKAEPLYKRAVTIQEKVLGPNNPTVAIILNNLAMLYNDLGDYDKAEPLYKRALAIRKEALGRDHPDVGESLINLAMLYLNLGDYGASKSLNILAMEIWVKALGPDHPTVGSSLNNLAMLYQTIGDYGQAEQLYKRSLSILQKSLRPDHPHVVGTLNNLGAVYQALGDYSQAELLHKRALAIREKTLGPEHPDVSESLNNLAVVCQALSDYSQAESLYKRALAIWEKSLGPNHPRVATNLNNLATLYLASGRVDEACRHFKKEDNPSGLGLCHLAKREYREAAVQFERALKSSEKSGMKEVIIGDRIGLGLSYEGKKDPRKAVEAYRKAVDLIELQRESLEPASRVRFLSGTVGGGFVRIQAYEGLARCLYKLGDHEGGFKAFESTKARVLSESISRRGDATILRVPEKVLNQEAKLTNSIAGHHKMQEKLFQNQQIERYKEVEKELGKLREEHKAFISQLRKGYPEYAAIKYPIPLSASEVKLQAGEVLLSYKVTDQPFQGGFS